MSFFRECHNVALPFCIFHFEGTDKNNMKSKNCSWKFTARFQVY